MSELQNEATLTVGSFTGKTDDGNNADSPNEPSSKKGGLRSRIKIKKIGAGKYGGDKVSMTGSEEDLMSYAKRHLGGEGDTLAQVASSLGESLLQLQNEATLTVGSFTGKTDDGSNADSPNEPKKKGLRGRIKIKVIGAGKYGGDKVSMTGTEEDLMSYAKRHLGGEGDTLAQVASSLQDSYKTDFDLSSKLEENIATYLEEGSCGSVHASYKKGKKLHATYNEDSDYQEFFKGVLAKFNVESPDELSDEKKKEFFEYIDANWEGDNEKAEDTEAQDSLVPNGEKKKKDLEASKGY